MPEISILYKMQFLAPWGDLLTKAVIFHSPERYAIEFPNTTTTGCSDIQMSWEPGSRILGKQGTGDEYQSLGKLSFQMLGGFYYPAVHHWSRLNCLLLTNILNYFGAANIEAMNDYRMHVHFYFSNILVSLLLVCVFYSTQPHWFLLLIWLCWLHKYKFYGLLSWLCLKCFPLCQFPMHFLSYRQFSLTSWKFLHSLLKITVSLPLSYLLLSIF